MIIMEIVFGNRCMYKNVHDSLVLRKEIVKIIKTFIHVQTETFSESPKGWYTILMNNNICYTAYVYDSVIKLYEIGDKIYVQ